VAEKTETEFFMNGVNLTDLGLGLKSGAIGSTSNPKHIARAIKSEKEIWHPVIDGIIRSNPGISDDEAADIMLQKVVYRSFKLFQPMYEETRGRYGYVAIQGNPMANDDLENVVERGIAYSKLGENIAVKVVSTAVGIKALEELTAKGINTIATKSFSVAQTIAMDAAYQRGLKRTKNNPKCWVVYSAGILDDYLGKLAEREKISISHESINEAGLAVAKAAYRVCVERGFKAKVMIGGRDPHHFTGLVGANLSITISDYTVKDILAADPQVISKIDEKTPSRIVSELEEKFPEFKQSYYPDGLAPDEFRDFGPCVSFQKDCEQGYAQTLTEIKNRRAAFTK
jgi:transaldolase